MSVNIDHPAVEERISEPFLEQHEVDAILIGPPKSLFLSDGGADCLLRSVTGGQTEFGKWTEECTVADPERSVTFLESELDNALHQIGQLSCKDAAYTYTFLLDLRIKSKKINNGTT